MSAMVCADVAAFTSAMSHYRIVLTLQVPWNMTDFPLNWSDIT